MYHVTLCEGAASNNEDKVKNNISVGAADIACATTQNETVKTTTAGVINT